MPTLPSGWEHEGTIPHDSSKQIVSLSFSIVKICNNIIICSKKIIYLKVNIPGQCIVFFFPNWFVYTCIAKYLNSLEEWCTGSIHRLLCLELFCVSLPSVPFFVVPVHVEALRYAETENCLPHPLLIPHYGIWNKSHFV